MDQPNQPVSEKQRFPTWKQALVMFLGGGALAISACFGCLFAALRAEHGNNRTISSVLEAVGIILGFVAFIGLLASLVGVVLVLMRMLRALFSKKDESGTVSGSSGSAS
jgi:hypothetical protein